MRALQKRVATSRGCATSFTVAAVITPSVLPTRSTNRASRNPCCPSSNRRARQHASVSQNRFDTEHQGPRGSMRENCDPAGIRGQISTETRAAFRCHREREQKSRRPRCLLHGGERHARFGGSAKPSASTLRIAAMRSSDSTISDPSSCGICPPTSPVFPDCGTTPHAPRCRVFRIAATSPVVFGLSTTGEAPT